MADSTATGPSGPDQVRHLEEAVDAILRRLPGDIVLALPLGLGKPNPLVNALYRRIRNMPERRLSIFTALSLEKPVGHSELERHFLAPLVDRVFADYPDLDYVKDARAQVLPAHIQVHEFFLKTGDYLHNDGAQQAYLSSNYSHAVRDMMGLGANLIMQAVACREGPQGLELCLSCNPDLSLDLIERMAAQGRPLLTVAVVNRALPFMGGEAQLPLDRVGLLVDTPEGTHTLFAPPNAAIGWADYAIGLHAASLVKDGGTLQIGIGSLGDAIAQSLILRDTAPEAFGRLMDELCDGDLRGRELGRFEQGLYGCSEMFVNGLLRLVDAGIVRRRVYQHEALQSLANEGLLPPRPEPALLKTLLARDALRFPLTPASLRRWQALGLFDEAVNIEGDTLCLGALRLPNEFDGAAAGETLAPLLGERWRHAPVLHGGFFLGPRDFYQRLRELDETQREALSMTRIGYINELYGDALGSETLKRLQRRGARFMNTCMKMSLLGAACSDALESGQVVSGVGGQYNFVAMGHALPDARSILMLRSTHENARDGLQSNIVWSYGHCTIPRHLRDLVITEYGVADLRGRSDGEVIQAMLEITDARFQEALVRQAREAGKLSGTYRIPERCKANLPEALHQRLKPRREQGLLPDFPFGTDLNAEELQIVRALKRLQHASTHPMEMLKLLIKSLQDVPAVPPAALERLGLDQAQSFKQLVLRRLFAANF